MERIDLARAIIAALDARDEKAAAAPSGLAFATISDMTAAARKYVNDDKIAELAGLIVATDFADFRDWAEDV
ncbi:MAG: hypothetical protein DSY80_07455, partial [Desulfocapsa sp.]